MRTLTVLLFMVFLSFPVLTHADDPTQAPPLAPPVAGLAGQAVIETSKDQGQVISGGRGIILKDRVTGKLFCISVQNGVLQSEPGNCEKNGTP